MADFSWGSDKKAVAITETDIKSVIAQIVEAVTNASKNDLIEQYKQFARQEAELAQAREALSRKDQEIAALRSHISTLNNVVATMAPVPGAQFNPYNNNGPAVTTSIVPTFPERYAATVVPFQASPAAE